VDDVRKREHGALATAGDATLSGSKYLWLYTEENLPRESLVGDALLRLAPPCGSRARRRA
jgi:hypothetical protein